MGKFKIQEIKVGLKLNLLILITFSFSSFFLSACAGKIVPEEERIETTYNFDAISGFNYFEVKESNRRNRRNPSGPRDNSGLYYGDVKGSIIIGKQEIKIESETINETFNIRSTRKRNTDNNRIRYTYKTNDGEFRIVAEYNQEVYSATLTIDNEDFFQFLVRR